MRSSVQSARPGGVRRSWSLLFCAGLAIILSACSPPAEDVATSGTDGRRESLVVFAVNYPLAYFTERIGGELVDVRFPIPPGIDPAAWSPNADTIAAFQAGDLILLNGAGYAAWVGRATLPASKLVDTSAAFDDRYLRVEEAVTHTHGPEGEHAHEDVAFTTWLDPELAVMQAAAVRDALIGLRPEHEAEFRAGHASMATDLETVDDGLRAVFAMLGGQALIFSHPVYQYLQHRYALDARSLHWEPDQALTNAELDDLNELRREHPASILVWEAEPLPESRRRLTELGVVSVVFDPCGNRPDNGHYLGCMTRNQQALEGLL